MLASYGSTKRYKGVSRLHQVNPRVLIAASGELSDFQLICRYADALYREDFCADDGIYLGPSEVLGYLQAVMYNRRNKFDPLWNSVVVGGVERDGRPVLGCIGMIGTVYRDRHVATGFGNHLARPLLRNEQRDDMPESDAKALMNKALLACHYRDKQSINKFQTAAITKQGVTISEPFALDMNWDHKAYTNPNVFAVGVW